MVTVIIEFPRTYRVIMGIIQNVSPIGYIDVSEKVDWYVEVLARIEVYRRWHQLEPVNVKRWLKNELWNVPLIEEGGDSINAFVFAHMTNSNELWACIKDELTITPNTSPLMWHVDRGVWKLLTSGCGKCQPSATVLSQTTSQLLGL